MKISVIIPVYNCEAYLRECVDSVLAQTHTDLDVILIDDGSTDASPGICDSYATSDSRVRAFHGPNRGQSAARNKGIDSAHGEYITFVDADDSIHSSMLEFLIDLATQNNADISACRFVNASTTKYIFKSKQRTKVYTPNTAIVKFLYQSSDMATGVGAQIFSSRLFDRGLRFAEGEIYEDLDLMHRLYGLADRIAFNPSKLYFYRINHNSTIKTWNKSRLNVLNVTHRIEALYKYNKELLPAAKDRRLSAAFNVFMLNEQNGNDRDLATHCYAMIKELRYDSFFNPNVRFKNKVGILCSIFGQRFLAYLCRIMKHCP